MWDIIRLTSHRVRVDLFLQDKDEIIRRMKIIRYICILTYVSWITCLRTFGSDLGKALGFELELSVYMVIVSPVGYPFGYSMSMLLVLALGNSFDPW